jgi:hypothetical protein
MNTEIPIILWKEVSANSDVEQQFDFGTEKLAVGFPTDAVCQNV